MESVIATDQSMTNKASKLSSMLRKLNSQSRTNYDSYIGLWAKVCRLSHRSEEVLIVLFVPKQQED